MDGSRSRYRGAQRSVEASQAPPSRQAGAGNGTDGGAGERGAGRGRVGGCASRQAIARTFDALARLGGSTRAHRNADRRSRADGERRTSKDPESNGEGMNNTKPTPVICPSCGQMGARFPGAVVQCKCGALLRMLAEPCPFAERIGQVEFNMLQLQRQQRQARQRKGRG